MICKHCGAKTAALETTPVNARDEKGRELPTVSHNEFRLFCTSCLQSTGKLESVDAAVAAWEAS